MLLISEGLSLDEYRQIHKIPDMGRTPLLQHLLKDQAYQASLTNVTKCYQLQKKDVNACAHTLYHELSKRANGNAAELVIMESGYTMTEVAALEAVFCALKNKGCFHIPMRFYIQ